VLLGLLTLTAMDAPGCRCREAPELPDSHFRLAVLSFLGSVGCSGAPGEAPRLVDGVT
jgi:hypothetical protein